MARPVRRPPPLTAEEIQARVLHRDGLILVIDKPAGLAVHAGPSKAPNLEECFDALRFGLPRPPALAHRLDADTSGVLVLGRHPKALSQARPAVLRPRHREDLLGRRARARRRPTKACSTRSCSR